MVKLSFGSAIAVLAVLVSAPATAHSLSLGCQITDSNDPGQRRFGVELLNQNFSVLPPMSLHGKPRTVPRMVLVPSGALVSVSATRVTPPVAVTLSLKLTSDLAPGTKTNLIRPVDALQPKCTAVATW